MEWFVVAFAFVAGAALGSFLNVVITRVPKHESIVRPLTCRQEQSCFAA